MEILGVIFIAIVILVVFAWFRPVRPESKTDNQLRMLHKISSKSGHIGADDHKRIEAEMKRRGLMGNGAGTEKTRPSESHLVQLRATKLRNAARMAYDEGWRMGEGEWGEDERKRHQHALTTVLLMRLQAESEAPPVSEDLINTLNFEAIPFINLEPSVGKDVIAEYVVWREHPELANIAVIQSSVDAIRESGFVEDVLKDKKDSLEWLPWAKLLHLKGSSDF